VILSCPDISTVPLVHGDKLSGNITINTKFYFTFDSSGVTFDGSGHTIDISGVTTGFIGLFQNGTVDISGQSDITIKNLGVLSSGSTTLATQSGWICQSYFGKGATNNKIENCYSTGEISGYQAGGICGLYAGYSGHLTITNCYSTGAISATSSGGIIMVVM